MSTLLTIVKKRIENKYPKLKLGAGFARGVTAKLSADRQGVKISVDHIDLAILEGMKLVNDTYNAQRAGQ